MKRILVTGASGFIGGACLRRLKRDGFEIHAVSRRPHKPEPGVRWHVADLRDHGQITALLEQVMPTHILHAAWEVTPRTYSTSPANADWLRASIHMAHVFRAQGGKYFLGLGTSAEYTPDGEPCREDETPIAPVTLYGQSKAAFRAALEEEAQRHGFGAGWLRIFVPFGPGDPPQRLIPHLMEKFSAGEIVETTHGRQIRDFIHVKDVAELCARMIEREIFGACNAGSGKGTPVSAVIEHLANRFGRSGLVRFDAIPLAATEPILLTADMTKTAKTLNFMSETSLFAELDDLASSYLNVHPTAAKGAP